MCKHLHACDAANQCEPSVGASARANGCPASVPLSFGTQIGDSLYERRVGGKVIPRDADALDPLSEFLQKALPSQCVAASGSDQSHGEGIRLQFVVA
jgi:hypothetical protein